MLEARPWLTGRASSGESILVVLYAPAICAGCGFVFRSDLAIADAPWISPSYRATGGLCPRCHGRGGIPNWVYRFHDGAVQSRQEATEQQRQSQLAAVAQHLRRHRTAKKTERFIQEFRGPWRLLTLQFKALPPLHQRAQLTFLLWILDEP
jgi:hypothetical protein